MITKGWSAAVICALMFISMALFMAIPGTVKGSEPPGRAGLYRHSETYNISFSKPTFYGTDDPYYSEDVKANTWDDIGIVVYFQDQTTTKKTVGSYTLNVADIYQGAFVPVDGTSVSTGVKQRIILEDFTACWCVYCTGVLGAMDRMNHDSTYFPDKYIGIEFHASSSNDVYYRADSATRGNFYTVPGYPTYVIDGVDPSVGGSANANDTNLENNIKGRVNNRAATDAPFSILAKGGHDSSKCWVDFTVTVEDPSFDNVKVDCLVVLVQDAHPRRHNVPAGSSEARLGLVCEKVTKFRVFDLDGTPPSITDISPAPESVISGDTEIKFTVADVDAPTRPIAKKVEVKKTTAETWTNIVPTSGKFIWKTNQMNGANHVFPDGDYDIRITATDFWDEETVVTVPVKVLNLDPPVISFNEALIQNGLVNNKVGGSLVIYWTAFDDEDGTSVLVDLFYSRANAAWTLIASDLPNTGSYDWNLLDPRVPDGERYRLKAVVKDSSAQESEVATAFEFEINNPDPPTVRLVSPTEGQELSGQPSIKWSAQDDEDEPSMLKADIYLSADDGLTYSALVIGAPNSGSYKFDTTQLKDDMNYRVKVIMRDSSGLSTEAISGRFAIYNNDVPECTLTYPRDDMVLTGSVEFRWTADDQEDKPADLKYDLMYMFSTSTYWTELRMDEPNTGSLTIDTTRLEEGDGTYTFRLVVKDSRKEMSAESRVIVKVYNPDAPVISERALTSPAAKKATLTWAAYDDDPGETDGLKVWVSRSQKLATGTETPAWTYLAEGVPNSGRFMIDVSSLEDGHYKVMLEVYDCTPVNLSAMYILDLMVDNNDPPVLAFKERPAPGSNNTGVITFSWTGEDPEGKNVVYHIYYRLSGTTEWITLASSLSTPSFSWNTSSLRTGDYQLRIVGVDSSTEKLESEIITEPFHIYVKPKDIDIGPTDDDDDGSGAKSDMNTVILLVLIITATVLIGLALLSIIIIRKRQEAAQFPPPGGMMIPPAMVPPQGLPTAPGQVPAGPLPPQTTPQSLPPAMTTQPAGPQGKPAVPQAPQQ